MPVKSRFLFRSIDAKCFKIKPRGGMSNDYNTEFLIECVTSIDWSHEHAKLAVQAIQETVRTKYGHDLSDANAIKLLGRLIEGGLIRTGIGDQARVAGKNGLFRKAKYFRIPKGERRNKMIY